MSKEEKPNRDLDLCHMLIWNRSDNSREWVMESIKNQGWSHTSEVLTDSINYTFNEWFHINKTLLHIFRLNELLGYDGDVLELLEPVGDSNSYDEVRVELGDELRRRVSEQWERGGTTWFFDVDMILTSTSNHLIPKLLEARKEEFGYVVNQYSNVDMSDLGDELASNLWRVLWNAWYGHTIHRQVWHISGMNDLSSFYPRMLELNEELGNSPESTSRTQGPIMSERFDDLLTCLWAIHRFLGMNQFTERLIPTGIVEFPRLLEVEPVETSGVQPMYEYIHELGLSIRDVELGPLRAVVVSHLARGFSSYPPRTGVVWRYLTTDESVNDDYREKVYSTFLEEVALNKDVQYFLDRDVTKP